MKRELDRRRRVFGSLLDWLDYFKGNRGFTLVGVAVIAILVVLSFI